MKKRNLVLGSVVVLAALLIVGGTMAWFTASSGPVTNQFTAGTVKIELHDLTYDDEQNLVSFPGDGISNVNPGDEYDKIVYVENTGSKAVYVRVKLTPNWTDDLSNVVTIDDEDYVMTDFPIVGDKWFLHTDGWYYYKDPVASGSATQHLIDKVVFAGKAMTNDYQGATFTLEVEAEAVQASHEAYKDEWDPALKDILTPYTP